MNAEMTSDRSDSVWTSSFIVLAGIWLILSPFVLLFQNQAALINDVVVGAVITVFAVIRAVAPGPRTSWLSWLNGLWGIWLIVAPFILSYGGIARPNDIIVGIFIVVFSLWSAASATFGRSTVPLAR